MQWNICSFNFTSIKHSLFLFRNCRGRNIVWTQLILSVRGLQVKHVRALVLFY